MLILTIKVGEGIHIGDDVEVSIESISGCRVKLGVTAPGKRVQRAELPPEPLRGGRESTLNSERKVAE